MVLDPLLAQINDILSVSRWASPDVPGSAHLPSLTIRLTPQEFESLRYLPDGEFILDLLNVFEESLNDDWLPFELVGLPLAQAKDFLCAIATFMWETGQLVPLEQARVMHRTLAEQVA